MDRNGPKWTEAYWIQKWARSAPVRSTSDSLRDQRVAVSIRSGTPSIRMIHGFTGSSQAAARPPRAHRIYTVYNDLMCEECVAQSARGMDRSSDERGALALRGAETSVRFEHRFFFDRTE